MKIHEISLMIATRSNDVLTLSQEIESRRMATREFGRNVAAIVSKIPPLGYMQTEHEANIYIVLPGESVGRVKLTGSTLALIQRKDCYFSAHFFRGEYPTLHDGSAKVICINPATAFLTDAETSKVTQLFVEFLKWSYKQAENELTHVVTPAG